MNAPSGQSLVAEGSLSLAPVRGAVTRYIVTQPLRTIRLPGHCSAITLQPRSGNTDTGHTFNEVG